MHIRLTPSKSRHIYDDDPATVRSSGNPRIRSVSSKFASNLSARNIISSIQRRDIVHRLDIGNSSLGDEGCVQLFRYFASSLGRRCRQTVTELFLTKNDIGAKGLLAIAEFLHGNEVIRELCLSGNPLTTDPAVLSTFTAALNTSRLCTLQLIHSNSLSDPFISVFLPQLTTPYLRQFHLSAIGMTREVVPIIVDYVSSPRCRLEWLQCNANSLSLPGIRSIINAIDTSNYSLWRANLDDLHLDERDGDGEERMLSWQEGWRMLIAATQRNLQKKQQTRDEALAFLRFARALFLRSGSTGETPANPHPESSRRKPSMIEGLSPFFKLPTELQQEIFSLVAPGLSHKQRNEIVTFASDVKTLPKLDAGVAIIERRARLSRLLTLGGGAKSEGYHPYEGSWRPCSWWECECAGEARLTCRSLRRWKREMRDVWLTQVGCDVWDPGFH
ncbi:hypothetical protein BJ138DRAFT_1013543 [Hygrophoropsis aurantiaca]|uniref:Uncharacterized protein n=2 Tax=Hygrophoropsis aurantiaca TaxID=72124 RepID=A0ACB7ZXM0_9AGAM|nr:hypothetical protein BJ138DRAFT_1017594 [Hygrophoropsis aurantiaca]KAH7908039.1 hypothetical protein BJ138DRAFT_1013543 [Hygrophoropsis aurantiaca]